MWIDLAYENVKLGGWVMIPIYLTGVLAFTVLFNTYFRLGRDMWAGHNPKSVRETILLLGEKGISAAVQRLSLERGVVAKTLLLALEHPQLTEASLREMMAQRYQTILRGLDKGLHFVGVLGAIAPLLGLLGTVEGMVRTFQVISVFGNSNPSLLSGGISEALVATQSGLLIAFPVILLRQRVVDRVESIKVQIESGLQELYLAMHPKESSHVRI